MSVSDISLMFQYVACKINTVPYGIKNINTYSARIEKIIESRDDAQRVVVVTYHNVGMNKKGEWI